MTKKDLEEIASICDSLDNVNVYFENPIMPAAIALNAAKSMLPELINRLKQAYIRLSGDNPREDWPFDVKKSSPENSIE